MLLHFADCRLGQASQNASNSDKGTRTTTNSQTFPASTRNPTLDMSFNRRPLDWTELQEYSPCSSSRPRNSPVPVTRHEARQDIWEELSRWNFPSYPEVPPRLLLWGPFNSPPRDKSVASKTVSSTSVQRELINLGEPCASTPFKTPKRRREHCLTDTTNLMTPTNLVKRPRMEHPDHHISPPPRYTTHPGPLLPNASLKKQYSMEIHSDSTEEFSSKDQICYSTSHTTQCDFSPPYFSTFETPSSQFYCNTSPPQPSNFQTPSQKTHCYRSPHYLSSVHSSPIWSEEWHHTYKQFRGQFLFHHQHLKPGLKPTFCS